MRSLRRSLSACWSGAGFSCANNGCAHSFRCAVSPTLHDQSAMENTRHPTLANGKICYLEIPALDINRSATFYKEVFGWQIRTRGDGSVAFDDGVGEVSGAWVLGRKPMTQVGLLIHIMVDSVAETMDSVAAK